MSVLYVTKNTNAYASGASESSSSCRIPLRVPAKVSTPCAMTIARQATKNPIRIAINQRMNVSPLYPMSVRGGRRALSTQ